MLHIPLSLFVLLLSLPSGKDLFFLPNTHITIFCTEWNIDILKIVFLTAQFSNKVILQMFYKNILLKIFKHHSANFYQNKKQRGENSSVGQSTKTFHVNT